MDVDGIPHAEVLCHHDRATLWSTEEEQVLVQHVESIGMCWYTISQVLPGRSHGACKTRYAYIQQREQRERVQREQREQEEIAELLVNIAASGAAATSSATTPAREAPAPAWHHPALDTVRDALRRKFAKK